MFESLSERLSGILDKITGRGALSEQDVDEALREVRRALLEADVALEVVRSFTDKVKTIKELQSALGLVAAGVGCCPVPASVQRLRRDKVIYRPLDEPDATSPVIMSSRWEDKSPELKLILKLIKDIYVREGITFGK